MDSSEDSGSENEMVGVSPAPPKKTFGASKAGGARTLNLNRFKYIPMRLSEEERVLLAVLENALEVCEYTDVVDVTFSHTRKSKMSRIIESLVDVLSISCGLIVSPALLAFIPPPRTLISYPPSPAWPYFSIY